MTQPANPQELRVIVPIEVTVRVGAPGGTPLATPQTLSTPANTLMRGAEKLTIDEDYSNRDGYDPNFIAGATIPLPEPNAKLAKQVAPLLSGEPNAANGELKYEHFSIKMHKAKRLAIHRDQHRRKDLSQRGPQDGRSQRRRRSRNLVCRFPA